MFRWTAYAFLVALFVAAGLASKTALVDAGVIEPFVAADDSQSGPRIGGPFTLVDHTGRTVTDQDFRGRIMLVFFGYIFCPDACPTAMQNVSDVLDILGPTATKVQALFISIDPERDTPDVLASFVDHFHPSIIGLTGSTDAVRAVARAYRVQFNKVVVEGAPPGDYLMDHSAVVYVVGPDGKFFQNSPHETAPEVMARRISRLLGAEAAALVVTK
jgi:cytochrome oxidase Cu insertion factor (SCO1/SenC/PrrC family)